MFWKSRRILMTLLRRSCAALLVVAFVASLVGMPVVKTAAKDRSQPFPCQDRPCGCASAEQCWKKCCCFNDRQKREWAKENHVALPGYFSTDEEQADAGESGSQLIACADDGDPRSNEKCATGSTVTESSCGKNCCSKPAAIAAAEKTDELRPVEEQSTCRHQADEDDESNVEVQLVIGTLARECQGLSSVWTLLSTPMLPEVPVTWTYDWSVVGCVVDALINPLSAELSPPVPPPRLSAPSAPSTLCA